MYCGSLASRLHPARRDPLSPPLKQPPVAVHSSTVNHVTQRITNRCTRDATVLARACELHSLLSPMAPQRSNSRYRISLNGPNKIRTSGVSKRFGLLLLISACILAILFLTNVRDPDHTSIRATAVTNKAGQSSTGSVDLTGHAVASKLGNETLKYGHKSRSVDERLLTYFARAEPS